MNVKSCDCCGDAGDHHESPQCFHCGCTVCGMKAYGTTLEGTLTCLTCQSTTHARCARDPFTGVPSCSSSDGVSGLSSFLSVGTKRKRSGGPGAGASVSASPPTRFYCSVDCALGVSLEVNLQWDPVTSLAVEEWVTARWEETIRASGEHGESGTGQPSNPPHWTRCEIRDDKASEVLAAYLQLRFEGWQSYFEQERLSLAHPLFFVPPWLTFSADSVLAALQELVSPCGQAKRLCALDALEHPIGSLVALPNAKSWINYATPVQVGDSNNYVAETREWLLCAAVQQPPVAIVKADYKLPISSTAEPSIVIQRSSGVHHASAEDHTKEEKDSLQTNSGGKACKVGRREKSPDPVADNATDKRRIKKEVDEDIPLFRLVKGS